MEKKKQEKEMERVKKEMIARIRDSMVKRKKEILQTKENIKNQQKISTPKYIKIAEKFNKRQASEEQKIINYIKERTNHSISIPHSFSSKISTKKRRSNSNKISNRESSISLLENPYRNPLFYKCEEEHKLVDLHNKEIELKRK